MIAWAAAPLQSRPMPDLSFWAKARALKMALTKEVWKFLLSDDSVLDATLYAQRYMRAAGPWQMEKGCICDGNQEHHEKYCGALVSVGIGIANPRAVSRLYITTEDFMRGQKFKVKKDKLIAAINWNRTKHEDEYREAVIGYHEEVVMALREQTIQVSKVNLGDNETYFCDPGGDMMHWAQAPMPDSPPQCHLEDYDQALRILEVIEDTKIEMDAGEIDRYMHDRWGWKDQHNNSMAMFSKAGRAS